MDFGVIMQYLPLYETAMWLTLRIGWIGILGSIVIGLVVAMVQHFRVPVLRQICGAYVELFRNTPLLIQLFFMYFALPRIGFQISAEACGMLVLPYWAERTWPRRSEAASRLSIQSRRKAPFRWA